MEIQKIVKINQESFSKEVYESELPTVVDFYADWCGPCRAVSPILEGISGEYEGKVKFLKVNVDDNPELSSKYGIMSIPTVMFFSGDKVFGSIIGAVPERAYKQKVKEILGLSKEALPAE